MTSYFTTRYFSVRNFSAIYGTFFSGAVAVNFTGRIIWAPSTTGLAHIRAMLLIVRR